ncbi:MAG: N-acetylmuramoyl-L-alanine amidase [Candidatus Dadabacteria bacterium]|nr:N-acetylmuramoyl-L-alanine amidase [Candidatus Dadabacteria bacterium]
MTKRTLSFLIISSLIILFSSIQTSIGQDRGEKLYEETFDLYKNLSVNQNKIQNKEIWETIARAFYSIDRDYPNSPKASNSLFLSGKMYEEMGERFNSQKDFDKSVEISRKFVRKYPYSNLADDAQLRVARIVEKESKSDAYIEYDKLVTDFPKGDMRTVALNKRLELAPFKPAKKAPVYKPRAKGQASTSRNGLTKVSQIRHWSTDDYTRVVIHLDKDSTYTSRLLKPDPQYGTPPRLFVDIEGATVDKNLYVEPITKGLLEQIKFARNTKDTVRVVLYINSFDDYKVFALKDPYRIVMDIEGSGKKAGRYYATGNNTDKYDYKSGLPEDRVSSLSEALGLKIRTVVIDAGHGGHDPGAIGPSGLKEKEVNLRIAKALKKKLDTEGKQFGITKVYLTRSTDKFIPLEERTGIAKKLGADLFISIHCNAARNRQAYGIETYILSLTNDQRSLAVAARENATTSISRSDMANVLKQYLLGAKIEESQRFASYVQSSVVKNVSAKYPPAINKGVKKAPFIVLIGADIPSILVETSFITNPRDERRLKSSAYINEIADGIFVGVKRYSSEMQTASIQ